jgi:hypothetical protein
MTLLFPVGHWLGPFHPAAGAPSAGARIRVGAHVLTLSRPAEAAAWALAHATGDEQERESALTVEAYHAYVQDALGAEGHAAAEALLTVGALVRVPESGAPARRFAAEHRLRPLLTAPAGPVTADGTAHRPVVDEFTHELWWWSGPSPDLWSACERVARSRGVQPQRLLDHFLATGHALVSTGAGYLDRALEPSAPAAGADVTR